MKIYNLEQFVDENLIIFHDISIYPHANLTIVYDLVHFTMFKYYDKKCHDNGAQIAAHDNVSNEIYGKQKGLQSNALKICIELIFWHCRVESCCLQF